jgi:hypothetical protein
MTFIDPRQHWILAHRGLWNTPQEQNTLSSLNDAFSLGFGVETDIRSYLGSLVISHDPILSSDNLVHLKMNDQNRFALNLKEDGMFSTLKLHQEEISCSTSFLFDGSMPQMYTAWKMGFPHALRISEFEREVPWSSQYLWIDGFETDWWMDDPLVSSLALKSHCVFVSPELHGRDYRAAFDWFAEMRCKQLFEFSVCTDHPEELSGLCD